MVRQDYICRREKCLHDFWDLSHRSHLVKIWWKSISQYSQQCCWSVFWTFWFKILWERLCNSDCNSVKGMGDTQQTDSISHMWEGVIFSFLHFHSPTLCEICVIWRVICIVNLALHEQLNPLDDGLNLDLYSSSENLLQHGFSQLFLHTFFHFMISLPLWLIVMP
jgi:hypothetical protein